MDGEELLAAAGIEIVERDRDTIEAIIQTSVGPVTIVADLVRIEDRLILDGVHVSGRGLRLTDIRRLAKVFGAVEDVEEVIVQGGERSSGARPGSSPTPIRIKVKP